MSRTNYTDDQRKNIVKKIEEAYHSSEDVNIKDACEAIGITNSTYYNWRRMFKNDNETKRKNNQHKQQSSTVSSKVEQKIIDLKKNKPFLGLKKISKQMAYSYGVKISSRKVKQVLKKHELDKTDYPKPKKKQHTRRFERLSRNEMWMMDIMYYTIEKEGRFYLISILDDYSRYIISYGIFKKQTMDNVIDVFHQAIEEHGQPDEFLTDRGSQFHSWKGKSRFDKLLEKMKIKHILARPQHPQTIGKLESFHRNIQRELLRQKYFDSIKEAKTAINDYIQYYNHERVHMGIDYLTPADRYFGLKRDAEKLLEPETGTEDKKDYLYLTGRIDGQPLRAKENNQGQVEVFLAGKKLNELDSTQKIKNLFEI